jgi:hypothetical protein
MTEPDPRQTSSLFRNSLPDGNARGGYDTI